jgi:hypothetical protein
MIRSFPALMGACTLFALGAAPVAAQSLEERLDVHGSLNAAYAKSDRLPAIGIPTQGTSDYRIFTLQLRYALSEKQTVVTQFLNRRIGESPLAGAVPDVSMQWAFWQYRDGPLTVKVGRNPMPRGLLNEVRYIGTLFPFFRPPVEVTNEANDALDGAVVTWRQPLGAGFELESHGLVGGTDFRDVFASPTGVSVRLNKPENLYGGQFYLTVPFAGTKLGAYAVRYERRTPTTLGYRTNTVLSGESNVGPATLRAESARLTGHTPLADITQQYVQGIYRVTDRLHVAGEVTTVDAIQIFTGTSVPNTKIRTLTSSGLAANWRFTPTTVLKFEHHWRRGYVFDRSVPIVASQTPTSVTFGPRGDARYFIVSLATSF